MNVETSRAQAENPLRNVAVDVMSVPAASLPRALRSRRWRTVTSSTSAFSNLCIPSPLLHPVASIKSLSSSRQELILALLFLSSRGFITFLYWWVEETAWSPSMLRDQVDAQAADEKKPLGQERSLRDDGRQLTTGGTHQQLQVGEGMSPAPQQQCGT